MKEIWKDIEGFSGYQISNKGRVFSFRRKNPYIMKPYQNPRNKGYIQVLLKSDSGKSKLVYVHRLVASAFIPNPENYKEVNHIIPVTKTYCNNSVENLEWGNHSHNMKHKAMCGNYHHQILTYDDVLKIREMYATGNWTQKELAIMFGYKQPNISSIVRNKIW